MPQDLALLARFSPFDCECSIDNLEVKACVDLMEKLNCLKFEGWKLICTGIISDSRCAAANRLLCQEGANETREGDEMHQIKRLDSEANEEVLLISSEENITMLEAELNALKPTIGVIDGKNPPKWSKIDQFKESVTPKKPGCMLLHKLKKTKLKM